MAGAALLERPETERGVPTLPPGAPAHLSHLLDELSESLELDAPGTSLRVLKESFSYLICYFSDLVEGLTSIFGEVKFPVRDGADLSAGIETIAKGLEFLRSEAPESLPEVRALVGCFYSDSTPRKFARLLGIGGRPRRGTTRLDKFIASRSPVRKKCLQELQNYLPHLREWLATSNSLFLNARVLSERTEDSGCQRVRLILGNQTLETGKRLRVSGCAQCVPQREITLPEELFAPQAFLFVPQKTPDFLDRILEELDSAAQASDPVKACLELGRSLEFLVRYFAGVSSSLCSSFNALPREAEVLLENSQSVASSERLLYLCLEELKGQPDSLAAKTLVNVFFRRNEHFEFIPRWHAEVLALSGQLAAWCQLEPGYGNLEQPEVCQLEFERHLPTLRTWLTSLAAYFQNSEHFFEEQREDGSVEFSLRLGDQFLEVTEPGYLLWLNQPRPEGEVVEVAEGTAKRPLISSPIDIPDKAPEVLSRILKRMDVYLRLGEEIDSCLSLRDAVDYLTRYFAGLAVAAFKQLGTLPAEAERLARSSLSVHECEKLLLLALRSVGTESEERLGQAVRAVFYFHDELSGQERPTGSHARLLALDADPDNKIQYIAEFCSLKEGEGVLSHPARAKRELERFLPALQDWLSMAGPLFAQCTHYEEKPGQDGKMELVIEFNDIYLELVAPDYIFYIRPGADVVPDIEAPELPEFEEFAEQDLDIQALRQSRADKESRPFIVHRVDLIGERENSLGVKCQAGYIVLTNAGGGTLSGMTVSTDPIAMEVSPSRFRGNKVQLSYWVNTDELPDTHEVFIELKTAHEVRSISVHELLHQKKVRPVSVTEGLLKLLAPAAVWMLAFFGLFMGVCYKLDQHLVSTIGERYTNYKLIVDAPDALYDIALYTHFIGYLYLWVAGVVPVFVGWIYRKLPPSTQELLQKRRRLFMVIPSVVMLVALATPWFNNHFTQDPDFASMHLRTLYLYFIGLNLAGTYYQELSLMERFDDLLIDKELRKWLPPVIGWFVFLTTIMLGVAG